MVSATCWIQTSWMNSPTVRPVQRAASRSRRPNRSDISAKGIGLLHRAVATMTRADPATCSAIATQAARPGSQPRRL